MSSETDIAIVGMAAHLPGARNVEQYWSNLRAGVESIRRLSEADLLEAGEAPVRIRDKNYVPHAAVLDDFHMFDESFFGFGPKEAAILDPQHRQFLEVAWEVLENAGHVPATFPGRIGVFAGCGMGSYFYLNVCSDRKLVDSTGLFLLRHTGNDKDFLTTRVSHVLDLRGPSLAIQTACSTSLVATHYACQSLLTGESDLALAGGVSIELPHGRGYLFREGEILSPDGHCYAFDHRARGTVFGSGAAVVALRRRADAERDGDHIWALIKGSAVNNDGAGKAGYLAPSVEGQARAVAEAHALAGVSPRSIGYIECHGTGTYLGDPIEVAALTSAFRAETSDTGFCRIGSAKTNIGHLDTAAGVAGLIKTALALHNRELPPSLNFEAPNPALDIDASPFRVNGALTSWTGGDQPLRAAVNSLGVGGTNAYTILEEAPDRAASEESDWPFQVLVVSGKSRAALDANANALAAHLREHPEQPLADVAFTLKEGRHAFEKRRVVVAATHEEAATLLEANEPRRVFTHSALDRPEVVFMFPGGGAQYVDMAAGLYDTEPVFREWMDRGLDVLQRKLDYDVRSLWRPEPDGRDEAKQRLMRPSVQLPLIMITEYALAQLWMSWGVRPAALVGHSMGENTAACVAGVLSFEDCISLVHLRGTLFDSVAGGGMLSVPLSETELRPLLGDDIDIASINAPGLTVASGPAAALDALAARLAEREIEARRVAIEIAAHSRMLEPILPEFEAFLRTIELRQPSIPIISNVTGRELSDEDATDPRYWVRHLRQPVRFAECIGTLSQGSSQGVYLEVGPGKALSSLAQAHGSVPAQQVLSTIRHPEESVSDDAFFLGALGRLWALGVEVDWSQIWGSTRRNRVLLPTYAFQRSSYFIKPAEVRPELGPSLPSRLPDIAQWGYKPIWRARPVEVDADQEPESGEPSCWLVFMDEAGLGRAIVEQLRARGDRVVEVESGDSFARLGEERYVISPERGRDDYCNLLRDLVERGMTPQHVLHLWLVTGETRFRPGSSFYHRNQESGFYSLLHLAQAISEENVSAPLRLSVLTSGMAQVRDEAVPFPEKATAVGPVRVIPRELPNVSTALLDVVLPSPPVGRLTWRRPANPVMADLARQVLKELAAEQGEAVRALRAGACYELGFKPRSLHQVEQPPLREGGVLLLTGGLGGIGTSVAEALVRQSRAKIVLVGRTPLPPRERWDIELRAAGPNSRIAERIAAIRRLEALGAEVLVATADVCNVEEMRAAVASARARFGAVHAVVHAAGIVQDAPLLAKDVASVEEVFGPKIQGTQVLHELFPDGELDWLALFSSTSTVAAPAGQVDYVAANEFLNAYARSRRGGRTRVTAINWGIWNEVGMAAAAVADRTGNGRRAPVEALDEPLLDSLEHDHAGLRFAARYQAESRWVLEEHRTRTGEAVLPGTGYLEVFAEALRAAGEDGPFQIRDVVFLRPLRVTEGGRNVRVHLTSTGEGYSCEVRSGVLADGREGFELNAQATIVLKAAERPAPVPIDRIVECCPSRLEAGRNAPLRSPQELHLRFGPRWRVLQSVAYGDGEGLARLRLPAAFHGDLEQGFVLHPALLDIATGWAMRLIKGYDAERLWVPVSYDRVQVYAPLPTHVQSWVRISSAPSGSAAFATFDVTICDGDGNVLVDVEGFTIRRLDDGASFDLAQAAPGQLVYDEDDRAGQALSPGEERLVQNLSQGILPAEGADAFGRALALGTPQVVVTSIDLDVLCAQAAEVQVPTVTPGASLSRPELDTPYLEPRNEIERTLARFWQELLGLERIGVEDSFFDLGGHSLIAVRLFVMVKKAFQVDLPISVLFEAPTIAKCAALLAERGPGVAASQGEAPSGREPRLTHVVAMHDRRGNKTPFFMVAGMFGNVLNLRHLAHLVGTDRPFYGLQARGLFGEQLPHASFEEAASDYIAEMRTVQPHGPYLLGGFSGGGITAWEIARQLEEAGEHVALLALLDTPLPIRPSLGRRDRILIRLQEMRETGIRWFGQWLSWRLAYELERRRKRVEDEPESSFHNAEVEAAFRSALTRYELRPWDGPAVLFRPPLDQRWRVSGDRWVSTAREFVFEDNDWSRFAPKLQVLEVPGDHDSMVLEPNVRVLAANLLRLVERAELEAWVAERFPLHFAAAAE